MNRADMNLAGMNDPMLIWTVPFLLPYTLCPIPPQYLADDLRQFSHNLQLDEEAPLPAWSSTPSPPFLPSLTPIDAAWHLKAQSLAGTSRGTTPRGLWTSASTSALGVGWPWNSSHVDSSHFAASAAAEPGTLRLARITASASLGNLGNGTNGRVGALGHTLRRKR